MKQAGLLPIMALNIAQNTSDGNGALFVIDENAEPPVSLELINSLSESDLTDYILNNSIYKSPANLNISRVGQDIDLSFVQKKSSVVGKEYNGNFVDVNTHSSNTTAVLETFNNVKIYKPVLFDTIRTLLRNSTTINPPTVLEITAGVSPVNLLPRQQNYMAVLEVSESMDTLQGTTITYSTYSGGNNVYSNIFEVAFSENIEADLLLFKCSYLANASYRISWSSLKLNLWYYDEATSLWVNTGVGAFMREPKLTAYRFSGVTAKRFRFTISGYFDATSGNNGNTYLCIDKFSLCKENTVVPGKTFVPNKALFVGFTQIPISSAAYLYPECVGINAILLDVAESQQLEPISISARPDIFLDGTNIATYNLDSDTVDLITQVSATVSGTPTYVQGKFGNAIKGNGSNTSVITPIDITALDNWSISFHVNNLLSGSGSIVGSSKNQGPNPKFMLILNAYVANKLSLSVTNDSNVNVDMTINRPTDNLFHHIAIVCIDRKLSLYFDGVFQFTVNSILGHSGKNLAFLSDSQTWSYFNGAIDQFRVFNRALTTAEITTLTTETIEAVPTGFVSSSGSADLEFDVNLKLGSRLNLLPNTLRLGATI